MKDSQACVSFATFATCHFWHPEFINATNDSFWYWQKWQSWQKWQRW
jgi:hypothetical protein